MAVAAENDKPGHAQIGRTGRARDKDSKNGRRVALPVRRGARSALGAAEGKIARGKAAKKYLGNVLKTQEFQRPPKHT
jgi:hypothetical protein